MKHENFVVYECVVIRPLFINDLEKLREWRNNKENTKFLSTIPYITESMQRLWYEKSQNDQNEMVFAIEEKIEINGIVGSMALYNFEEERAEFGKILIGEQRAHGKKIGFRSICALLHFSFDTLGLREIYLHVSQKNIVAYKLYKAVGFKESNTIQNSNGEIIMTIRMDMFKY